MRLIEIFMDHVDLCPSRLVLTKTSTITMTVLDARSDTVWTASS